ncbi:PocR ligand-binding domain-containing protein [Thermodesulfobacteriota bacterium B35]
MTDTFPHTLPDLVDLEAFQALLDSLYDTAGIPSAVIDLEGMFLTATGWQRICLDFHRKHPVACRYCVESDTYLRDEITRGASHAIYQCPHGLVDGSAPIVVDGQHLANVFTGQVLTGPVDDRVRERFRAQAHRYGFDEQAYLAALAEVPVVPEREFRRRLDLLSGMAEMLAREGLTSLNLLRQQALLEKSERRFRCLLDQAMDPILVLDGEGRLLEVNRQACGVLGYDRQELLRLRITDIDFGPAGRLMPARKLAAVPLGGRITMESLQRRRDGTLFPVEISMGPVCMDDEAAYLWMVRDISERRQAEESLREAYEIINTGPVVAFRWRNSPDWPVEFVSANVENLLGYSADDFLAGRVLYTHVIAEEDLERVRREVDEHVADPACTTFVHQPYRVTCRDGGIRWVSDHTCIRRDRDGTVTCFQGLIEDITARVEAEQALVAAEREWRKIFDAISDIVTIQDRDMRIVRANRAAGALFDLTPEEVIRQKCYRLFRGCDDPCPGCPALETIRDRRDHWGTIEHETLGRIFQVSSAPILDDKGEMQFLVHIAKDITEKKQLEDRLIHAGKMEAIGTLAEGIAHDFNNILAAILGFSQLTLMQVEPESRSAGYLQQVVDAANRARDLVRQILTFSSKGDSVRFPLSIGPVVRESLKLLRASLPATVEMRTQVEEDCGMVMANPTAVQQVVVNLCTNAFHAMEEQGVLTVALCRCSLTESEVDPGREAGLYVELRIADTGRGMEADVLEHIFEPYFTTRELGDGSGMGLALVHGIVQGCDGMIRVESAPGRGTTFRVYFPLVDRAPVEGENPEEQSGGSGHILVVDDEPTLVELQRDILEQLGYTVTTAGSGTEALELLRAGAASYDLVITDQTMPGLTGIQLAEEVRALRPDLPLILCTGYGDILSEEEAGRHGIRKILAKPVESSYLAGQVREILARARREASTRP